MSDLLKKIRSSEADIVGQEAKDKLDSLFQDKRFVWFTNVHMSGLLLAELADKFVYSIAGVETPIGFVPSSQPMNILRIEYEAEPPVVTTALIYTNGVVIDITSINSAMIVLIDQAFCDKFDITYNTVTA